MLLLSPDSRSHYSTAHTNSQELPQVPKSTKNTPRFQAVPPMSEEGSSSLCQRISRFIHRIWDSLITFGVSLREAVVSLFTGDRVTIRNPIPPIAPTQSSPEIPAALEKNIVPPPPPALPTSAVPVQTTVKDSTIIPIPLRAPMPIRLETPTAPEKNKDPVLNSPDRFVKEIGKIATSPPPALPPLAVPKQTTVEDSTLNPISPSAPIQTSPEISATPEKNKDPVRNSPDRLAGEIGKIVTSPPPELLTSAVLKHTTVEDSAREKTIPVDSQRLRVCNIIWFHQSQTPKEGTSANTQNLDACIAEIQKEIWEKIKVNPSFSNKNENDLTSLLKIEKKAFAFRKITAEMPQGADAPAFRPIQIGFFDVIKRVNPRPITQFCDSYSPEKFTLLNCHFKPDVSLLSSLVSDSKDFSDAAEKEQIMACYPINGISQDSSVASHIALSKNSLFGDSLAHLVKSVINQIEGVAPSTSCEGIKK